MTSTTGSTHSISQPTGSYRSITISLILVSLLTVLLLFEPRFRAQVFPIEPGLSISTWINGFIVTLLFIGIGVILRELHSLSRHVEWLQSTQAQLDATLDLQARVVLSDPPDDFLKPIYFLFANQSRTNSLTASTVQTVMDAMKNRVEERRDLSRWLIQTLILIGLIGTFWGLLGILPQIGTVLQLLGGTGAENNAATDFNKLLEELAPVLGSMGIAFSSSFLGLSGSLILGFLELQVGTAKGRYIEDLEGWLHSEAKFASQFQQDKDGKFDYVKASQSMFQLLGNVSNNLSQVSDGLQSNAAVYEKGLNDFRVDLKTSLHHFESSINQSNDNMVDATRKITALAQRNSEYERRLDNLTQVTENSFKIQQHLSSLLEDLNEQARFMDSNGQQLLTLAETIKEMAQGNTTSSQLTTLSAEVAQLAHAMHELTENLGAYSRSERETVITEIQGLIQVLNQLAETATMQNSTLVEHMTQQQDRLTRHVSDALVQSVKETDRAIARAFNNQERGATSNNG